MPRGYRGAIYAIGLIALAFFSVGTTAWLVSSANELQLGYQQHAKTGADGYTNRANIAAESRCLVLSPEAASGCIREEREAARQGRRDEYDLEAQRTMAVWTQYMGIAAIVGMGVGIFGIGLIFVTFRETRRAAEAAHKTHNAFIAVERPRLALSVGAYWKDGETLYVRVDADNLGKTTGFIERVHYNGLEDRYPDQPFRMVEEVFSPVHAGKRIEAFTLGSDIKMHGLPYLGGYIEYRSPFDQKH